MKREKKLQARSSSGVCVAPHVLSGKDTAVSPSTLPVPQPNHTTPHPTTETHMPSQQASKQAKPRHTRNTRSTKQLHKAFDTSPLDASPILQQSLVPKALSPNNTFK